MNKLTLLVATAVTLVTGCTGPRADTSYKVAEVYTSTRYVTAVTADEDGSVWAATRGGVLHYGPSGKWQKFTQADGLPSNEALNISTDGGKVIATFPQSTATWDGTSWEVKQADSVKDQTKVLCSCVWLGKNYHADLAGLHVTEGSTARSLGMPPSTGSHISALLPRGDKLWAALHGDGLWEYDGKEWSRTKLVLPEKAREITALARSQSKELFPSIWIGTRREGLWKYDGWYLSSYVYPDEPHNTNCQAACAYKGKLYISTLEDGLVVRHSETWTSVQQPKLSSNAPRQMVEFDGKLYVRHGNGKIDCFDVSEWQRDVFQNLPRKQASCIAADSDRIYIGQWGGWSEFDGKEWKHHLQIPELQGLQTTVILPEKDVVWVGTQGRGLAEIRQDKVTWNDERNGLPDDWIKFLIRIDSTLYAGTFVGGLARLEGSGWKAYPELKDTEVTGLVSNNGELIVAARTGVYRLKSDKLEPLLEKDQPLTLEAQTLCVMSDELWVGTRTSLVKVLVDR